MFALLLGVDPEGVHGWYPAVYVDAVEWVELPNTLGMSQFGEGGTVVTKPYGASGNCIQCMSNFCRGCRYERAQGLGEEACPFTTLYWDSLLRHEGRLGENLHAGLQLQNLGKIYGEDRQAIRRQAGGLPDQIAAA